MGMNSNGFNHNNIYRNNYVDFEKKSDGHNEELSTPNAQINENTFVAISDTNFGSTLEQSHYLDCVFDYVETYGIHDIVHCGNLLQSTFAPLSEQYNTAHRQVNHVLELFPEDIDTKVHILLGANDFHALKRKPHVYKILESRRSFNIMGYKKANIKWGEYIFSAFSYIQSVRSRCPDIKTDFNLCGTTHSLSIEGKDIFMPPLSMDVRNVHNENFYPGFIVVHKNDNEIIFTYYAFIEGRYITKSEEVIKPDNNVRPTNLGEVLKLRPNIKK
ncbi:MAG: hypothetical protein J1F35_00180 [Erysipelotrichales bacterium]|nr:hypothetical protein [Erysipelotrichales bacterium]